MDVTRERERTDAMVRAGASAVLICLAALCLLGNEPAWWWVFALIGAAATTVATGVALERWLPDNHVKTEAANLTDAAGSNLFVELEQT